MPSLCSATTRTARPPIQASTCGQRIVSALPLLWARSVSLHDGTGYLHWHYGEELSAPEHEAVRVALQTIATTGAPSRINHSLERERTAVLLRAVDDNEAFMGFVMVVVSDRWLQGKGSSAPDLPAPVIRAVREWGNTLGSTTLSAARAPTPTLTPNQVASILESEGRSAQRAEPAENASAEAAEFTECLKSVTLELQAHKLTSIQPSVRIQRYDVQIRVAPTVMRDGSGIAPGRLLELARARGQGDVLDRRVVSELLEWLTRRAQIWPGEPAQFAVKLLANSLSDANFVSFVRRALGRSQLPRGLLAFEVEHDFCVAQPQYLAQLAVQLEQAGAGLVIDNFTLSDASPDLLLLPGVRLARIAPSVNEVLLTNRAGQARVAAIARMARVAGVHVLARRVDLPQEQALLQALGVDFIHAEAADANSSAMNPHSEKNELAAGARRSAAGG